VKVRATLRLIVEFRVEPLLEIARGAEGERKQFAGKVALPPVGNPNRS
jgi:hypothetical protein